MEDSLSHLQFREVKLRYFREDMLVLKALPIEQRVEFKSYLHQNGRYTHVHEGDDPVEPIPEARLFDEDLDKVCQLCGEKLISYITKMVEEKRYIIVSQYDDYKTPQFPKAEHNHSIFFNVDPEKYVDYRVWLEDFGAISVTLLLDRFVNKYMPEGGYIYLLPEDTKYIGLMSLEDMSSGFKIVNSGPSPMGEFVRLSVSPENLKDVLIVPNNPFRGFSWCNSDSFYSKQYGNGEHKVLKFKYGHKYILNIPVSGEFELAIFYQPKGKPVKFLTSRQFCCK